MQNILIAALAAFFLVNYLKTIWAIFDKTLHAGAKQVTAYLLALGIMMIFGMQEETRPSYLLVVVWALAATGLASLFHKLHRLFSVLGDEKIRNIMAASLASAARRR